METLTRKAKFPVRHTIAWNDCWKKLVLRSYHASKKRGRCLRCSDPASVLVAAVTQVDEFSRGEVEHEQHFVGNKQQWSIHCIAKIGRASNVEAP